MEIIVENKKPFQSKKFLAYLIADIGWKVTLLIILFHSQSKLDYYTFSLLLTLVIVSGFIQVGYILGQASLDKYTKVVKNITDSIEKK
jgi:hypothetical protein